MASVVTAKYRCDPGIAQNAATIRLALPSVGDGQGQLAPAAQAVRPARLNELQRRPRDPGQLVTISPIEGTPQAASILH